MEKKEDIKHLRLKNAEIEKKSVENALYHFAYDQVSEILTSYIWWVIEEAQKHGIRRLYFLSRDGYIFNEIAQRLCQKYQLDIDCRYLYVSRIAVRIPTLCIDQNIDEMYDKLTFGSLRQTPVSVLKRFQCEEKTIREILQGTVYEGAENQVFSVKEYREFVGWIKNNKSLKELMIAKSTTALGVIKQYFAQEGLLDEAVVGVVDCGWRGSLQKCIQQVLDSMQYRGELHGFYFGLYNHPEKRKTYHSWYFKPKGDLLRKALFNCSVFECLLSAPHPMTIGYRKDSDGRVVPVFENAGKSKMETEVSILHRGILDRIEDELIHADPERFFEKGNAKRAARNIMRIMSMPDENELLALSGFVFCDDLVGSYQANLIEKRTDVLKHYTIPGRLRSHMSKKGIADSRVLWPFGTIASYKGLKKSWYWINYVLWELARWIIAQ